MFMFRYTSFENNKGNNNNNNNNNNNVCYLNETFGDTQPNTQ